MAHCHHMAVINTVGSGSSSRGSGRGRREDFEVYNCHENHLLHLHKGAGLIRDARRGNKGRVLSPLLPLQRTQQRTRPSLITSASEAAEAAAVPVYLGNCVL